LFTPPHLLEPTERIRVDGRPVSEAQFTATFAPVHKAAEAMLSEGCLDMHPTYFETVTAMALVAFHEARTDAVVLEVGLGGRLDATNVIQPAVTVITPVDYDHEALLGKSLEAIAAEKAGILKAGAPAVFTTQRPEAARVLEARAAELGVPVRHTRDWPVRELALTARGSEFTAGGLRIRCPLAGEHQVENAVAAAMALAELGVPANAIEQGIAATRWPGRLERVAEAPEIILDGAHNPAGARALAAYIDRFYQGRRVWIIYGAMRDKAIAEMSGILFGKADRVIVTAPAQARAARPETLLDLADHPDMRSAPTLAEALELAREAAPEDVIFVTGSLFLVAEAERRLMCR
jgi:dihydrofolate synthase/folylpolyglutamate synthase